MFSFIILNIFLIAFAMVLYIVVRALPRVGESEESVKKSALERWVTSGIPEKLDATLNAFLAKTLRKSKVIVLRVDNFVTGQLKRLTHENGNGKPKPDFKEMAGDKPAEETTETAA